MANTVAYLGPKGSFTHLAALEYFGQKHELQPFSSIDELFEMVENGTVDYALSPLENSCEGVVTSTLDALVSSNLKICGEITLPIEHHLACLKHGVSCIEDIEQLVAHPQAIAQCKAFIKKFLPKVSVIQAKSSSEAIVQLKDFSRGAAIVSKFAIRYHSIQILKENLEDYPLNSTRFFVISNRPTQRSESSRSSLLLSKDDLPGSLMEMLSPFAENNVNLTCIQSRPVPSKAWHYIFYIELEGHINSPAVQQAVKACKQEGINVKVLGSYPVKQGGGPWS